MQAIRYKHFPSKKTALTVLAILLCLTAMLLHAAIPAGSMVRFTLTDGSVVVGRVYQESRAFYYVTNDYGVFPVARARVAQTQIIARPPEKIPVPAEKPQRRYGLALGSGWGFINGEFKGYVQQRLPSLHISGFFRQKAVQPFLSFEYSAYRGLINPKDSLSAYTLSSGILWFFLSLGSLEFDFSFAMGGTYFKALLPDDAIEASGMRVEGAAGTGITLKFNNSLSLRVGFSVKASLENSHLFVAMPLGLGVLYAF